MYTTLNEIKEHSPCADGWAKLLAHLSKTSADDEPLALLTILDSNGFEDALWALRAVGGHERETRLLACDYAEHVLHLYEKKYPLDTRPRDCISVARRYANGDATAGERDTARAAALASARNAAWNAERDAAWDARAKEKAWHEQRLRELLTNPPTS